MKGALPVFLAGLVLCGCSSISVSEKRMVAANQATWYYDESTGTSYLASGGVVPRQQKGDAERRQLLGGLVEGSAARNRAHTPKPTPPPRVAPQEETPRAPRQWPWARQQEATALSQPSPTPKVSPRLTPQPQATLQENEARSPWRWPWARNEEGEKREEVTPKAPPTPKPAPQPQTTPQENAVRAPWYWPWAKPSEEVAAPMPKALPIPKPILQPPATPQEDTTSAPWYWPWAKPRKQAEVSPQPISPLDKPVRPPNDLLDVPWLALPREDDPLYVLPTDPGPPDILPRSFEQPHVRVKNFAAAHAKSGAAIAELFLPKAGEEYIASIERLGRMHVLNTEIIAVGRTTVKTRSRITIYPSLHFSDLQLADEHVMNITWRFFEGQWRIEKIDISNWSPIFGAWSRKGLGGNEPDIELRLLPNNTYVVFADQERILPTYRGTYKLDGDSLAFTETWRADGKPLVRGVGRYTFVVKKNSLELKKDNDPHRWRGDRFAGKWNVVVMGSGF